MYTSHVGKNFIKHFNKVNHSDMSVKEYFEQIHFPLFYDNERYLHSPGNTPLFQLIVEHKTADPVARTEKKGLILKKIDDYFEGESDNPDMSFALGYPSADLMGTTSGQISSIKLPLEAEDLIASWVGVGFGIGIAGGLNILFDDSEVLMILREGMNIYREYVNENDSIKNKIETWNGLWFVHRLSDNYVDGIPRANFQPITISSKGEGIMERATWIQIAFALSKIKKNQKIVGNIYSFGQMNKTLGFLQFMLNDIETIKDIYNNIFAPNEILTNKKLAELYDTEFGFYTACQMGVIGLRALEPKDLKKFMPGRDRTLPKLKTDDKSIISYYIYQLWIIAMLKNKDLLELADKSATQFKDFVAQDKKVSRVRINAIEGLLASKNRKEAIDNLNEIVKIDANISQIANELVDRIMLDISPDNISLFITLLRFKYLSNTLK